MLKNGPSSGTIESFKTSQAHPSSLRSLFGLLRHMTHDDISSNTPLALSELTNCQVTILELLSEYLAMTINASLVLEDVQVLGLLNDTALKNMRPVLLTFDRFQCPRGRLTGFAIKKRSSPGKLDTSHNFHSPPRRSPPAASSSSPHFHHIFFLRMRNKFQTPRDH